jgi:hypothetical protein
MVACRNIGYSVRPLVSWVVRVAVAGNDGSTSARTRCCIGATLCRFLRFFTRLCLDDAHDLSIHKRIGRRENNRCILGKARNHLDFVSKIPA